MEKIKFIEKELTEAIRMQKQHQSMVTEYENKIRLLRNIKVYLQKNYGKTEI